MGNLKCQEFGAVTGICVSQGCVFPAHISLGMLVSRTHITNATTDYKSHAVICVSQGNMFPLKFHRFSSIIASATYSYISLASI